MWCVLECCNEVHLVPVDDYRLHEVGDEGECWCRPDVDTEGVIKHNALDGREWYENGAPLQ
jgi:hypothetical protein